MSTPQILKHMAAKDIPVFATFLFSPEGQEFQAWEFDVIIGDPHDPGAFYPPKQRKQAMYLNALKIDAVGWFFKSPTLIECKPAAGLGAIGQVIGYQEWYRIIFGIKPRGMIVCSEMSRQVQTLCLLLNIEVRIVVPANPSVVAQAIDYIRPRIQKLSILPQYLAVA